MIYALHEHSATIIDGLRRANDITTIPDGEHGQFLRYWSASNLLHLQSHVPKSVADLKLSSSNPLILLAFFKQRGGSKS
jgi:hypothetical protein